MGYWSGPGGTDFVLGVAQDPGRAGPLGQAIRPPYGGMMKFFA